MNNSRRDFLKKASLAGAGAVAGGMLYGCDSRTEKVKTNLHEILESAGRTHVQDFNMSGYSAPPLPVVRIGVIGLGDRGGGAVERLIR